MIHHEAAFGRRVGQLLPGRESRTDRTAGIAAGRLDVELLERRAFEDLAVGHGVVGTTARQHDGIGAVAPVQGVQQIEEGVLVGHLGRSRDVAMTIFQGGGRIARRPKQVDQRIAPQAPARGNAFLHRIVGTLAGGVAEIAQIEGEAAVVLEPDDLLHLLDVARLAIGREAHHLVLVAVVREADELRHRLVEDAQRMREVDAAVDRDLAALAQTPGRRGKIAEAVH